MGVAVVLHSGRNRDVELAFIVVHDQNTGLICTLRRSRGHLEDIGPGRQRTIADDKLVGNRSLQGNLAVSLSLSSTSCNCNHCDEQNEYGKGFRSHDMFSLSHWTCMKHGPCQTFRRWAQANCGEENELQVSKTL